MTPIQKAAGDSAAAALAPANGYHRGGRHSRRRSHVHSYVAVPVLERFELGAAGDRIPILPEANASSTYLVP